MELPLNHAEPLYRRALAARKRVLGPMHPETLRIMNSLATLLYSKGDYAGAEPLFRTALDVCERLLGPEHPETATTRQDLFSLLEKLGKLGEASQLHNEA